VAARDVRALVALTIGMAVPIACTTSEADAARSCGAIGAAASEAGNGLIYEVEGAVRSRGVRCYRARRVVHSYISETAGEGGRERTRGFRCRGGPRTGDRFIADCRRDGMLKRIYLEGTGGPSSRLGNCEVGVGRAVRTRSGRHSGT
jgi:hypothetical protein